MSVTEPDKNELTPVFDAVWDARVADGKLASETHSEHVQRVLREAAEKGFYLFPGAPYGYRKIAVNDQGTRRYTLEPDPQTIGTVGRIFDARLQGTTVRDIAKQLNDGTIPSPTGHRWNVDKVRRILSNEVYCGTSVASRRAMSDPATAVRVPNAFPAIIPQHRFDRVQQMK